MVSSLELSVFGSVVAVVFQIAFRADISISKRSKKYKPHSILVKKK